jgi:phosphatidylglycerophosphate synthase
MRAGAWTIANTLTAARVLLAPAFAYLITRGGARAAALAALALAAAIATDVLDGVAARRHGTASAGGGAFDHAADCVFVTTGLAAGAGLGDVPWILPVLVPLAFAQYVYDSYWLHRERALRASALGRYNGILYFAPLVGAVLVHLGLRALEPAVSALGWLLVVSTLVSMADRAWAVTRAPRTAPGSRAGERADRPSR